MISLVKRDRSSNGTFLWLDGHTERVNVHRVGGGSFYASWPDSIRTVRYPEAGEYFTGERPAGWSPTERLTLDTHATREEISPNGVSHLVLRGRCVTCGRDHSDWSE